MRHPYSYHILLSNDIHVCSCASVANSIKVELYSDEDQGRSTEEKEGSG